MCGRYSLTKENISIEGDGIRLKFGFGARYNVAPTQRMPVIVLDGPDAVMKPMTWSWYVESQKSNRINAKTASIRKGIYPGDRFHRCLIPADAWYEWPGGNSVIFEKPRKELFCFAGICTSARLRNSPRSVDCFAIVTTLPNAIVKPHHPDSMPVIVRPDCYYKWLQHYGRHDFLSPTNALNQNDNGDLHYGYVQPDLRDFRNEGPELIRPFRPPQQDLF